MAPKRQRLITIVLAATKGGVGKTTLSSALAVRAAADGKRVALLDTDPQKSLARWHELRGEPDNPKIIEVDASMEALALVQAQKWDYLIVDTPPAFLDKIEAAIYIADLVVAPIKPSGVDVEAYGAIVQACAELDKPLAIVLNQVARGFERLALGIRKSFESDGVTVFKEEITFRKSYVSAMTLGKSGPEHRDREAAKEIDALWGEIKEIVHAG